MKFIFTVCVLFLTRFVFLSSLISFSAKAGTSKGNLGFGATDVQLKIQLPLGEATVNLNAGPQSFSESDPEALYLKLKSSLDPSLLSAMDIEMQDSVILLKQKKTGNKKIKIDLSGFSVNTEIFLKEGTVNISKWRHSLSVIVKKGKIISKNGVGFLRAHVHKGEIFIQSHQGKIVTDIFQGPTFLKELTLTDSAEISSFMGDVFVEKTKGPLKITGNQSAVKILESEGSLQFDLVKGSIHSNQFNGRVEGQGLEALLTIIQHPGQDIQVKTNTGKINLSVLPQSGSLLNLSTNEGELTTLSYLHPTKQGSGKFLKARLNGVEKEGQIFAHSLEGNIVLK